MDIQKIQEGKVTYSEQCLMLMKQLPDDFPLAEFEEWVQKNAFIVGTNLVIAFLEIKDKKAKEFAKQLQNPIPNNQ